MRIVLFAHGGSGNHGCEALIRTIPKIIKEETGDVEFLVATMARQEDLKYGVSDVDYISYAPFQSSDPRRYVDKLVRTAFHSDIFRGSVTAPVINEIRQDDIWISIGGDNYSYPGVIPYDIIRVHNAVVKKGAKSILWGCSINKENISGVILKDLENYDAVIARESITYGYLQNSGIAEDKLFLYPDSAFTLPKSPDFENELIDKPYVGINISPVVLENGGNENLVFKNYSVLIQYILQNTDYHVALIPHVVWSNSDDRKPLTRLFDQFQDNNRVKLVQDHNACELKSVIASSEIFVGARTHATIAAYSSCVPTLVVGYSVKSAGIAYDLFGNQENYVISSHQMRHEDDLKNMFMKLEQKKELVTGHLHEVMPRYIKRAWDAKQVMKML